MVQIAGKYQVVKNEKFAQYLVAIGLPEEKANAVNEDKSIINISVDGKNVTVQVESKLAPNCTKFILDQEVDENISTFTFKSTATLSGDTLTVSSKYQDKGSGKRVYKFSDTGLVVSYSLDNAAAMATRTYTRL